MAKIIQTGTGAAATFARSEQTILEATIDVALSPLSAFGAKSDSEFIDKKTVGMGMLGAIGVGIFVGDKYGASIPLIGGRRGF